MIIGLMTAVERQQYYLLFLKDLLPSDFFTYKSVSKNYICTTVFQISKPKKFKR